MNASDARVLWARLRDANLVDGEAPVPDLDAGTPWPVRWLTGVGAWIAVPLLIGAVLSTMNWGQRTSTPAITIGLLLAAASLPWSRGGRSEFQRQTGTVLNLAGILLLGLGVGLATEASGTAVAATVALTAFIMFVISTQWLHRFLCAGVMLGGVFWLLVGDDFNASRRALAQVLVVWGAMALWLIRLQADPARLPRRVLDPLAWAFTLAALMLAWFEPWLGGYDQAGSDTLTWVARLATAAALPLVALTLVYPRHAVLGTTTSVALVLATIMLAWLWRWAPGVTVSISLLLLAIPLGASVLAILSVGWLGVSLFQYYFHLGDTLLAKAFALAVAGGVVLVLYLLLRARSREVAS